MPPLNQEERLRLIAGRVTGIPTLPSVMARVLEMIEDPQTNASQLARFIAFDQAYTVKILKLANSAFYGRSRKVGTVEQALAGVAVADRDSPIEAMRVVRAFDPCLACAVH